MAIVAFLKELEGENWRLKEMHLQGTSTQAASGLCCVDCIRVMILRKWMLTFFEFVFRSVSTLLKWISIS